MNIGIDASRSRSGGGKAHIIGIINSIHGELPTQVVKVHLWAYKNLLDSLPNFDWLIKHCPSSSNKSLFHQLKWQYYDLPVEAKKNKIDIMLNTDAGTVCRFFPSVTMSRDMLSYEKGEMQRFGISFQRLRLFILKIFQNYSLKNSTAAIFLTRYASEVIQQSSGKIKQFKVIPHGVSDNFRIKLNSRDLDANQEIMCIYVSNVSFYKHQTHVAKAIANLRQKGYNIKIKFVGGGEGRAQLDFASLIAKLDPDSTYIEQLEFVKHNDLPPLLQQSDIFVFASSCENMPNTLIEGMSSGLPIVCSNRGPMPEVLRNGGEYFDPEVPDEIADAIEKVILNREFREEIREISLELSKEYSWKRCAFETFNYLIEVVEKK